MLASSPSPVARLLLVLNSPKWSRVGDHFANVIVKIGPTKRTRLYVHLVPGISPADSSTLPSRVSERLDAIKSIYAAGTRFPGVDLRVFRPCFMDPEVVRRQVSPRKYDRVIFSGKEDYVEWATEFVRKSVGVDNVQNKHEFFDWVETPSTEEKSGMGPSSEEADDRVFNNVVLGGTFDRIHTGHKILLAEAQLRSLRRITIGVTDTPMLTKKTLSELILPCEQRIAELREYLEDCDLGIEYNIVPIKDPFGPSIVEDDLEAIIGSEESKLGCQKVNEKRLEKGLKALEVIIVGLQSESKNTETASEAALEAKVSSSNARKELLGELLKPPQSPRPVVSRPYLIGLTGGSASGKSTMARRFSDLGAGVVDCDGLGHTAYQPGTECFEKVADAFGRETVIGANGEIDRAALGRIVFADPAMKSKLESIVWPEILKMAEEATNRLYREGKNVVILDAAVLLTAGWHEKCDEVWCCIVSRSEAVRRIVERDRKTEEEAVRRIESQPSNAEVVARSNVVFCAEWSEAFSLRQAQKAWRRLMDQIDRDQVA